MRKYFYIVPVFNKEKLIFDVLSGIVNTFDYSCNSKPTIITIIDGCTDGSENEIDRFQKLHNSDKMELVKLYKDNVHEIKCLNAGLTYIQEQNPDDKDLVFMVQDDVILKEPSLNLKVDMVFNSPWNSEIPKKIGYLSMRLGVDLFVQNSELCESNHLESEFGHWNQLNWTFHKTITRNQMYFVECAIRSPTCVLWGTFKEVGFFDEELAPCGYDCHDFSIRCNKAGFVNLVVAFEFFSDVNWGATRDITTEYHKQMGPLYVRNRKYLAEKHKDYFGGKNG